MGSLIPLIVLGEGNFWFCFRLFIQFLALWSMDEKMGKLDNRAEAEFKTALAKYHPCFGLLVTSSLGFKARLDSLACVLCRLPAIFSSDSPLMRHLLTSWQPACCHTIQLFYHYYFCSFLAQNKDGHGWRDDFWVRHGVACCVQSW